MINLILFGVDLSGWSGEKPSKRVERIVENVFEGTGMRGGGLFGPGVPYVKDQAKLDEADRLLEEEVEERAKEIWEEMEKKGE
jgi:hypothetical protein